MENSLFMDRKMVHYIQLQTNKTLELFTEPRYINILNDALTVLKPKFKTQVLGYVILPDAIKLLIFFTKKSRVTDYVESFKKFSRQEIVTLLEQEEKKEIVDLLKFTSRDQKYKLWETSFVDERLALTMDTAQEKLKEIHLAPVELGLCKEPVEYQFGSAIYYEQGALTGVKIKHYKEVL